MLRKRERIYGIRKKEKSYVIKELGFNSRILNFGLLKSKESTIKNFFKNELQEKSLRDFNKDNINFLKNIKSYRGVRHTRNLPVRGQRTHTNAKTVKKRFQRTSKKQKKTSKDFKKKTIKSEDFKKKTV